MDLNSKNFDECCRTCLRDVSTEMYEIFQKGTDINIAEMLTLYTSIQVDMEDRLPKNICNSCFSCLVNFHEFKATAENADAELREQLTQINDDSKKDVAKINNNNLHFEIKLEDEYNQYQMENDCLDDSVDSVIDVKEEINPYNLAPMYSDISDASQREEQSAKLPNIKLTCEVCNKQFKSQTKLNTHKRKHKHKKYVCNICSKTFLFNYKYVEHLVTHRSDSKGKSYITEINPETAQKIQCDICSANFKSTNSLAAHKRKHVSKDRVLSCSVCSKVFKKTSHLKRHELSHENNRPFKCSACPKSFTTKTMLTEHENRHNGIKPHSCPICPKAFAHLSTLTNHLKIHTRGKPYLCPTCGKRFDSSTNLNQHTKRHLGLKLFACNLCPRKFVSKGELKSHGVTHTGIKSYACDECNATFTKCSSLKKHKLRHLGIKPFQCESCLMKFSSKDHLKRHTRIHTGERPYKCDLCDRSFTQSGDLMKHTRSHLGNTPYKCNQCSQSFRLKTELRTHISEHYISSQLEALKVTSTDKPQAIDSNDSIVSIPLETGVVQTSTDKEIE
ncbi:hypothetical protein PYW07_012135 [Mythimna separata]|uniref:Uncharacterized protein n=1 Tax=Mythimna separata TaxID=271217 RepID=A0AAD7YMT1_MYTSE|nr:hypothetical protein PYW07_012135 [Mythimna separata]